MPNPPPKPSKPPSLSARSKTHRNSSDHASPDRSQGHDTSNGSLKSIEKNVVHRRTQFFEQDEKEASAKCSAPLAKDDKAKPIRPTRPPPPSPSARMQISSSKAHGLEPAREQAADDDAASSTRENSSDEMQLDGSLPRISVAMRSRIFEGLSIPDKAEEALSSPLRDPIAAASANESVPEYAKVRKTSKPKEVDPSLSAAVVSESIPQKSQPYDGVVILSDDFKGEGDQRLRILSSSPNEGSAPPKPPRTFAHDDYLRVKAEKMQRKRDKHRSRLSSAPMEHLYEEIQPERPPSDAELHQENSCELRKPSSGRPGGKLPPPPRPPRPPSLEESDQKEQGRASKVVRVVKHNDLEGPDSFLNQAKLNNPGYAKKEPELLHIKTFGPSASCVPAVNSQNEEYLYVEEDGVGGRAINFEGEDDEPIYQDPLDAVRPRALTVNSHGVVIDADGYAVPQSSTLTRQKSLPTWSPGVGRAGTLAHGESARGKPRVSGSCNRKSVRDKVSQAYSILHLNLMHVPDSDDPSKLTNVQEEEDSDTDIDLEDHRRRLRHVNSVRDQTFDRVQVYSRTKAQPAQKLFDLALIVGLEKMDYLNLWKPKILFQFPAEDPFDVKQLEEFCFPDASVWRPVSMYDSESYSFVLTREDGSRQYGYCRRMLPPGSCNRLPEVICVVSACDALGFYEALLVAAERRRCVSLDHASHLLQAAYAKPLPAPGQDTYIRALAKNDRLDTLTLTRPRDACCSDVCFGSLLTHLPVDMLLHVFASVLLERRVIFLAQHLSTLTSCIRGLLALLYPFVWQHTLVPVLPASMVDVVCAPTPFVIGVLTSLQPKLQEFQLEEVLIVDLDNKSLLQQMGDEAGIIPKKLQKALTSAVKEEAETVGARDMVVSEAFLRLFVETCGHYTEFIVTQQDGLLNFQKEAFVKAVSSKSILMFLEWFTETQMFEVFITDKVEGRPSDTELFESRVKEYREEMAELESSFAHNVKQVGKKMLNFFMDQGDKIKKKLASNKVYV